jgi:ATP-binding cassette, subfamily B, bacterial PglK
LFETFKRVYLLVGRENPLRWVIVVVGAFVSSAVEMLGALLIYVMLGLVAAPEAGIELPVIGDLGELLGDTTDPGILQAIAVVIGLFFLVRLVVMVGFSYVKQRLAHNGGARLAGRLALGYLQLPYAHHLQRNSSELLRNAHHTVEDLAQQAFLSAITAISEAILVVGLVVVMVTVAPLETAMAVVLVGGVALLLFATVQPRLKRLGSGAQEQRKATLQTLQQALEGIRDVQVLRAEERFAAEYRQGRESVARSLYLRGTLNETPRLVIETTLIVFILTLFGVSMARGTPNAELLSTLGLFAYAGLRLQPSLQKLLHGLNSLRFAGPAVDQVTEDLELIGAEARSGSPPHLADTISFERELRFDAVSFTYPGADRPALIDVNLSIRPGEMLGVCGESGSGKTTVTDLLIGLLRPSAGRILVDGVDIADHRDAWFDRLGVVPQSVFLLDDTIRANVTFGGQPADEDELTQAIRLAQLDGVTAQLPLGLETVVGERGTRLSGGQRQRIAIARALYRRPSVLVLDEGTSALDNVTEASLLAALEGLRGRLTIIVVAHRISTIERCDRVAFMDASRLTQVGSVDELLAMRPAFREVSALDP